MKVATLTFHRTTNYGALFQTFALQKVLERLGYETEVLDYRSNIIETRYRKPSITYYINPKNIVKILFRNSFIRDNRKTFTNFSRKINVSSVVYDTNNIRSANALYDRFVVGSDQVWNWECMGSDPNYLLGFADSTKKTSYAASFGVAKIPDIMLGWYKSLLMDFKIASVREQSGKVLFEELTQKEATVVLDPTLIINEDWVRIALSMKRIVVEKYVLVYLMKETKSIFSYAKEYAHSHGCRIVYINDRLFGHRGIKSLYYTSPEQWLNLFYHAECIFTNSFHGTCFSINLNKLFWVEMLPSPSKVNSRLRDILKMFELEGRILENKLSADDSRIDYNRVNAILDKQREVSMNFLKMI